MTTNGIQAGRCRAAGEIGAMASTTGTETLHGRGTLFAGTHKVAYYEVTAETS